MGPFEVSFQAMFLLTHADHMLLPIGFSSYFAIPLSGTV